MSENDHFLIHLYIMLPLAAYTCDPLVDKPRAINTGVVSLESRRPPYRPEPIELVSFDDDDLNSIPF